MNAFDIVKEKSDKGTVSDKVYMTAGVTVFMPVILDRDELPVEAVYEYWNGLEGKPSRKHIMWGVVLTHPDEASLPEGWETKVVTVVMPASVQKQVVERFTTEYAELVGSDVWKPATVDDEGNLQAGPVFIVNRSGKGLNTQYTVSSEKKAEGGLAKKVPFSVELPESTLVDVAKDYTEWQKSRVAPVETEDNVTPDDL